MLPTITKSLWWHNLQVSIELLLQQSLLLQALVHGRYSVRYN